MKKTKNILSIILVLIAITFTGISCNKNQPPEDNPTISNIVPDNGPKTTVVDINGQGFGYDISNVQVYFNDKEATVQSVESNKIVAIVPVRAFTGNVKVVVNGTEFLGPIFNYIITEVQTSTFAGTGTYGDTDGVATIAQFNYPNGVAFDQQGNLYVVDFFNNKIRKITPSGVVSTFAGTGVGGDTDGAATTAQFYYPRGLVFDQQGNLYVTDNGNNKIRKITPSGVVSTFAGSGIDGDVDGSATVAQFSEPNGIVFDQQGNLYVADSANNKIRKITPSGVVSTFAGTGIEGDADGSATTAQFSGPNGLAFDQQGNLYVTDSWNNKIRKITPSGVVSTFAGTGIDGDADGSATTAQFNAPNGLTFDQQGNLYVADSRNNKIRKITPNGIVGTFAGTGVNGSTDGSVSIAQFSEPNDIIFNQQGDLYVSDSNNKIRKTTQE